MKSYLTVTDQFCGAGGSSIGAVIAGAEIRQALNHWKRAVETYSTNHPDVAVDCTDISACDPRRYASTDILITSPECTNHSLAKGKQRKFQTQMDMFGKVTIDPAEERSRATMWDVPRFAEFHNYNLVIVENVVDARNWRLFDAWLQAMFLLDYNHEIVYFNSMFAHPTPQSRDRMYIVFWKRGNQAPDLRFTPSAYCPRCGCNVAAVQSWKNPGKKRGRYGKNRQYLYRCPICAREVTPDYYCAANAIDWTLPSERIGDRKKPLKEKTMERIRVGLEKYGRQPFMVAPGGRQKGENRAIWQAFSTQTGTPTFGLVYPGFVICTSHGDNRSSTFDDPLPTQTSAQEMGLVSPLIVPLDYTDKEPRPVTDPWPTQTSRQTLAFVVSMRDAPNYPLKHVTEPLPTQSTVGAPYLVSYYSGSNQTAPISDPVATVSTHDRHGLVQPDSDLSVEDCYFRMLKSHEIGKAMAFPETYIVTGNERERVKQYGNAVTPPVMAQILDRCIETLR